MEGGRESEGKSLVATASVHLQLMFAMHNNNKNVDYAMMNDVMDMTGGGGPVQSEGRGDMSLHGTDLSHRRSPVSCLYQKRGISGCLSIQYCPVLYVLWWKAGINASGLALSYSTVINAV